MLIGLVGKPSAGKSTLFEAMTSIPVARAAYPFTTIEPNHGVGYVRIECVCKEFGVQCNPREGFCRNGYRFVPVELLDVAGLVPGAHEGKGLGNKFLDDLREADVLIHVVDASGSTNEKGEQVEPGSHNPVDDVMFLEQEIQAWMLSILKRHWVQLQRKSHNTSSLDLLAELFAGLKLSRAAIEQVLRALNLYDKGLYEWSEDDVETFIKRVQPVAKPIIICANKCDLPTAEKGLKQMVERLKDRIIIPCSGEVELALRKAASAGIIDYLPGDDDFEIKQENISDAQKKGLEFLKQFLKANHGSGVQKLLNTAVFDVLGYVAIFPGGVKKLADDKGNVLPDCFLMPPGSTAKDFARRIHSDLADRFIKAIDVRTKRALGADYLLKHRDVLEIVFRH